METSSSFRTFFLIEGILFLILGFLAIAFPVISTLSVELFLGWLFIISGIIQGYRAFKLRHHAGVLGASLNALLSLALGILLLIFPVSGIISITILLMIFFALEGIFKIIWGVQYRESIRSWSWLIFSGLMSLALAIIIWLGWPGTAMWALGLLVGINLIFFGASLLGIGMTLPKQMH
jgi:uncharacterized membrane protein HdeD (DUF308 family)